MHGKLLIFYIDHARKTCVMAYLNLRAESQKYRKLCHFGEKQSHGLYQHRSVRPVLLCKENGYVFVDFLHEFDEIAWGWSNNSSKQYDNPVIHQQFRESKIQVVILPLKGHKANLTKLCQAVMQENARKWEAPGRWAQKQVRKCFWKHK